MPYIDLPGVKLWYTDTDTDTGGTPVVFLHAASGNCDSWTYQSLAFTAAGYRCVAYDRRNWGCSQPADTGGQPGYVGDDLHGLVDHLHLDRFHLVATAAGGIGALDYALDHPDLVRSVVAANTIGGVQDPSYLEVQRRLRPTEIQNLPIELRELGPSYRGTNLEGTEKWILIERSNHPDSDAHPPAQPLRNPITLTRLRTMTVPVLMVTGDADLLSPPALMRLLANPIPDCQIANVPEAGHSAFWESPELWNSLVLDFLRRH